MDESKDLVIFGTTDSAKIAHYYFSNDSELNVVAFTVDSRFKNKEVFCGLPVVPFESVVTEFPPSENLMFVAMGYTNMNRNRAEKFIESRRKGYSLATYVSSRCSFLSEREPGENCFILEDNTIQPFVEIGENVVLWSGNHIGHDVKIGSHSFITSHVVISGNTTIRDYCFLGVNSTIRDSIELGKSTLVGAGASIMSSTEDDSVWLTPKSVEIKKKSSDVL